MTEIMGYIIILAGLTCLVFARVEEGRKPKNDTQVKENASLTRKD